ncbi:MAG: cytidylyltransferase domain-containing protein [Terriglobales bacterium]
MTETLLCAIPARGGSKRLPRKNLLPLQGKPMLAYSIEAARASGLFSSVFVCTEDPEIAETAHRYGAQVPILAPPELCGDLVASHVPCQHLATYLAEQGRAVEALLCLQPSSPLRSPEDIRGAVETFFRGGYESLVSVTPVDPHFFHWAVVRTEDGSGRLYFGDRYLKERPLLPTVYSPNGSVKVARLQALRRTGHFFGPSLGLYETPAERSVHVATALEARLCELLLSEPRP